MTSIFINCFFVLGNYCQGSLEKWSGPWETTLKPSSKRHTSVLKHLLCNLKKNKKCPFKCRIIKYILKGGGQGTTWFEGIFLCTENGGEEVFHTKEATKLPLLSLCTQVHFLQSHLQKYTLMMECSEKAT